MVKLRLALWESCIRGGSIFREGDWVVLDAGGRQVFYRRIIVEIFVTIFFYGEYIHRANDEVRSHLASKV